MTFAGIFASLILAADTPPGTVQDPRAGMLQLLGPLAFMLVIMYVLMWRPQQKRARELTERINSLKSGDKIITSSGILGVVVTVKDKSVTVRSGDTKLELLKSAVSEITERSAASAS